MSMQILNRNLAMLQIDQTDKAKDAKEDLQIARQKQQAAKVDALQDKEAAGKMKGDAADAQTRYSAVAAGLAAAGAAAMLIPVVGQIIGAILLAVAAVFALLAHLEQKGKQQEAAKLEKEAGTKELEAEKLGNQAEEIRESDKDRAEYVDQLRDQLRELNKEQSDAAKA